MVYTCCKENPLRITVIGLGHLGAVAAAGLAAAGHEVTGIDVDDARVAALRAGRIPFYEPGLPHSLTAGLDRGNLRFLHCEEFTGALNGVAIVTAGTPTSESGETDLGQVRSALAWVRGRNPRDLVLVMKSTVPPGSGLEFLRQDLRGLDIRYVANPEFLREGRALCDWQFPGRIVLGADSRADKAINTVRDMYTGVESPFLVTDITSAEMIKYASNAFLATRISFINEMASLCDATGASIDAVSDGLALDGRMGSRVFAGVGFGGSCLPKDIRALKSLADSAGLEPTLIRAVASVNNRQRSLPMERLNARFGGHLDGLRVGVLGIAFKPGTDDIREAPSLDLIRDLERRGAKVRAYDPKASDLAREALPASVDVVATAEETAEGSQALILLTEWQEITGADWEGIAAQMSPPRFLLDGRNALDPGRMAPLGFEYMGIGRGNSLQPGTPGAEMDNPAGIHAPESETNVSVQRLVARRSELRFA